MIEFLIAASLALQPTPPDKALQPVPPKIIAIDYGPATRAKPLGNFSAWLDDLEYPARSLRDGEQGAGIYRLYVGKDGRVQDCEAAYPTDVKLLDAAACRALTRVARFDPALNSLGQPTEDEYEQPVTWQHPDALRRWPFRLDWTLAVGPDGMVEECQPAREEGICEIAALSRLLPEWTGEPLSGGERYRLVQQVHAIDWDAQYSVGENVLKADVTRIATQEHGRVAVCEGEKSLCDLARMQLYQTLHPDFDGLGALSWLITLERVGATQ